MFVLPELKNPYSAYGPYFDETTMEVHHQKHHAGYISKLNQAMVDLDIATERIEDLFENIEQYPAIVRNNAGGHYNHSVFWSILNNTMSMPSVDLMNLINAKYGVMDDFKAEFTKAALGVFGSGWVWLVIREDNEIDIITTKNQDTPLMSDIHGGYPLLGLDLWEHAYYLKYQNRRLEYINAFWSLVDWNAVTERFLERPELNDL